MPSEKDINEFTSYFHKTLKKLEEKEESKLRDESKQGIEFLDEYLELLNKSSKVLKERNEWIKKEFAQMRRMKLYGNEPEFNYKLKPTIWIIKYFNSDENCWKYYDTYCKELFENELKWIKEKGYEYKPFEAREVGE